MQKNRTTKLKARSKSNNEAFPMAHQSSEALTFYDDNYTYIDTSSSIIHAKDNATTSRRHLKKMSAVGLVVLEMAGTFANGKCVRARATYSNHFISTK